MLYTFKRNRKEIAVWDFSFSHDKEVEVGNTVDFDVHRFEIIEILERRKAAGEWTIERPDFYNVKCRLINVF